MHKSNHNSFNQKKPLVLAIGLAMAFATNVATAQDEQADEFMGLEEVIVTATRRAESLQDVGMAITAITDQELERMGAVNLIVLPSPTPPYKNRGL